MSLSVTCLSVCLSIYLSVICLSVSVCLSICWSVCLSYVCLLVCLSIYLSVVGLSVCLSIYLSYVFVCHLSVCLSYVCLSACLSVYLSVSVCPSTCMSYVDMCGFGCYRPKEHCSPSDPFLCHSCPRVFNVISFVGALSSLFFLWIMSLSAVGQGCARIFSRFLSLAYAFFSQLDSLLSSFLCPIILWLQLASAISQGCVRTFFLLSELGVRLRLTVRLSFVS